jgi:tetratricopeptide (TPR) repeat protein
MVLAWQGQSDQAATTLEQVVTFVREQGQREVEVNALRYLMQAYSKLGNDDKVLEHAQRGLELVEGSESEVAFTFLEAMILAYYRMNLVEAARQKTSEAIELAQSRGDLKKEFEMRLSLAEACIVSGELEAALETYTQTLELAKRLKHKKDEARLMGRIGFALAEMGRLDEAVPYHQRAVKLARDRDIPDLEGEQLSMLAIAYMDKRELEEAKEYALKAVEVYEGAELVDEAEKARSLISQMENSNP